MSKLEQEKKVYEVLIAGLTLKLRTSHDPETVNELVSFVNQKINEALPLTKTGSLQNAGLLACLNIAEEMILLKKKALGDLDKFESKTRKIISHLESSREQSMTLDN